MSSHPGRLQLLIPVAVAAVVGLTQTSARTGAGTERALLAPIHVAAEAPFVTPTQQHADPDRGKELFQSVGCLLCHAVDGRGGDLGPDLTTVGARPSRDPERWPTTQAYIRSSIREPQAFIVPGYGRIMPGPETFGLSDQDVEHVVAYLRTLGRKGGVRER
jgi:cytochrome c2